MQNDPAGTHTARAKALWDEGRATEAQAQAWAALDADPADHEAKVLLCGLLMENPRNVGVERAAAIARLLSDPQADPDLVAAAGWHCVKRAGALFADDAKAAPAVMAARLESDALAQSLLREALVADHAVEAPLTALRRWLLLSHAWRAFPNCAAALVAQAAFNGGAWLFDDEERAALDGGGAFEAAYRPRDDALPSDRDFDGATTQAVARQYQLWPYPVWSRIIISKAHPSLRETVRRLDPDGPDAIAEAPDVLVAGSGTGREAALTARRYTRAKVTAIDISETSLRYAAGRNAGSGIDFRLLDLHRVRELGCRFDAIFSSGVLHHLPDPEAGWAALADVLKPGGVMRLMLYSKIARLSVRGRRKLIADLADQPVDADLLRAVRRRILERSPTVPVSADFYSLCGVHDLLLHRHEDAFDVARIRRGIARLGLELLAFELPNRAARAAYRSAYPADPLFRDYANWQALELKDPNVFARMYGFWCRKPL